ncbi:hypothetical protein FZEAL_1495 [Fusarium zealandicum]|uniref:Uncharacterized protein n=1 Tax=Fusarium zealandicum TaxID=1053134 RepID=A0A8H4XPF5_9HYPO|nr:hypothetical protein FZEAL_1495 [Fusarium zealandicum]
MAPLLTTESLFARADIDPELCIKYAPFASHMVRWQFNIIYWTMFVANLAVLFAASWTYTRGQAAIQKLSHNTSLRSKRLRQYIIMCLGCVAVSTVIVVMEAYAILALQFCDGEDLISLYWSTWTMIQVGSLIAMMGIILALANTLRGRQHPPWALALGTPVLVIAGLLHLFHDCTKKRVKKQLQRNKVDLDDDMCGPPMSQANTISVNPDEESDSDTEFRGEVVGLTFDGGPIVRFTNGVPESLPEHAELIGYCVQNRPIIVCKRDSIQLLTNLPSAVPASASPDFRKGSTLPSRGVTTTTKPRDGLETVT